MGKHHMISHSHISVTYIVTVTVTTCDKVDT